jgi:hypothetical protein
MTHKYYKILLTSAASFGLATPSLFAKDEANGFLTTEQQRTYAFSLVQSQRDLTESLAERSRENAAAEIARRQHLQDVDQEAIRQIGQIGVSRNQPLIPSHLVESLAEQNAKVTQSAFDSGTRIAASSNDMTARFVQARWPAQAEMYKTTADAQLKLGQMIATCVAGGAGAGSDGVASFIAGRNATTGTTPQPMPISPAKVLPAVKAQDKQPSGASWIGGHFSGAGASGSWSDETAPVSRKWGECATGAAKTAVSCMKPAFDLVECVRQGGGPGPYGVNIPACLPAVDPSDLSDCIRDGFETATSCAEAGFDSFHRLLELPTKTVPVIGAQPPQ